MRTSEEMFPVVEDCLQSGLTQKEYSKQNQLAVHILPYWVGRYRQTHSKAHPQTASFIQVSTAPTSVHGMEVALPSGVVIRFANPVPVVYLQNVLERLPEYPVNRLCELLPPNWKPANISAVTV